MHLIHPASRTKPRFGVRKTRNKRGNGPPSSPPTSSPHRWRAFRPPLRSSRLGPSPSQSRPPASRPFPDARPAPTSDSLSRLSPQKLPSPARSPARSLSPQVHSSRTTEGIGEAGKSYSSRDSGAPATGSTHGIWRQIYARPGRSRLDPSPQGPAPQRPSWPFPGPAYPVAPRLTTSALLNSSEALS